MPGFEGTLQGAYLILSRAVGFASTLACALGGKVDGKNVVEYLIAHREWLYGKIALIKRHTARIDRSISAVSKVDVPIERLHDRIDQVNILLYEVWRFFQDNLSDVVGVNAEFEACPEKARVAMQEVVGDELDALAQKLHWIVGALKTSNGEAEEGTEEGKAMAELEKLTSLLKTSNPNLDPVQALVTQSRRPVAVDDEALRRATPAGQTPSGNKTKS